MKVVTVTYDISNTSMINLNIFPSTSQQTLNEELHFYQSEGLTSMKTKSCELSRR